MPLHEAVRGDIRLDHRLLRDVFRLHPVAATQGKQEPSQRLLLG